MVYSAPTIPRKKAGTEKSVKPLIPKGKRTTKQKRTVKTRYSVERGMESAHIIPLCLAKSAMIVFSPK